jgi:hypothetical protein
MPLFIGHPLHGPATTRPLFVSPTATRNWPPDRMGLDLEAISRTLALRMMDWGGVLAYRRLGHITPPPQTVS